MARQNATQADASGVAVAEADKPKRVHVRHPTPVIGVMGSLNELKFHRASRDGKYAAIVNAILSLSLADGANQYVTFVPNNGENVTALKARISSLVSRSCLPKAPFGTRYRCGMTEEGHVAVYVDKAKPKVDTPPAA